MKSLILWRLRYFTALAVVLFCAFIAVFNLPLGIVLLAMYSCAVNRRKSRLCAVTLSVPELLFDTMDAFKLETPELFQPGGFGTDFSSKTAVLNDTITAKISLVPVVGTYNAAQGGFKNAAQNVTTLIQDVPVTLNQFAVVVVDVSWLTQLASKVALYKEAVRNYGYALGQYVVQYAFSQITPQNFSNFVKLPTQNVSLDTFDGSIRNQLNTQKAANRGRYCFLNTAAASALGQDDRVRSSLFYGALNGGEGYRVWRNLAGFGVVREYPAFFAGNNLWGFAGESRAIAIASRQIDYSNAAAELNVPKVMEFYPMIEQESGLNCTGVAWQEVGTGDVYVGCGVLFGVGAGNQGGQAGAITDNAGVPLYTQ